MVLLDSHSCWGSGCYLPDGAHLTDIGIRRWYDFLAQNLLARGYLMDDLAAVMTRLGRHVEKKYY